ncbi:thioesterase family protein [Amycolatopsis cynarae]|uniref:Thioesterase family protein n=1 Tax=Amycolatopsis cynarae TaxID=2995223 RepID=A0ABY7BA74_9PSEU|nr:thioesterase family protein [Amycolatopsis sp. HUAS 11-8]WAL68304.1 thioesterase family protein [Amycolatopsis sp. HUAS 11-8]
MLDTLSLGDVQRLHYRVPPTKTVPHLYPESEEYRSMPEVFATGFMVGLLEWCAILALRPVLEEGEASLGTRVDIRHSAPTPPGARLTVTARCIRIEGTYVEWEVEARDDDGEIAASGIHGRNVITTERFLRRVADKAKRLADFA